MSATTKYSTANRPALSNAQVASALEELADLLEAQGANVFRVRAYRSAAGTLRQWPHPVQQTLDSEGRTGLVALPGIGASLSRSIAHLCQSGRLPLLQRLRGETGPEHHFMTLPGIGLELACRIHEHTGAENLPELAMAARDGRLARVPGLGRKRLLAIQEGLRARLRHAPAEPPGGLPAANEPPVAELLDVDREYRAQAAAGQLRKIAPRRFNPAGKAWLPVLHTWRGDRHYSALYSNTARAHELGTTHDWVIIYRDDREGHGQWTAITSRFGALHGKRIVRGREGACAAFYASHPRGAVRPAVTVYQPV